MKLLKFVKVGRLLLPCKNEKVPSSKRELSYYLKGGFILSGKEKYEIKLKYCPNCGESLLNSRSLLNEYWISNDIAYFCYCSECSWKGEILEIHRVTAPELA